MKNITMSAGRIPLTAKQAIEQEVQLSTTTIRYVEAGVGLSDRPLVLLHGFRAGSAIWFPHSFPQLAAARHVIGVDLPGFGGSGTMGEYTLEQYAAVLDEFLGTLGYPSVDLLGHSMGAQVAIGLAARYPGRVARLVLVDSAGLPRFGPSWRGPLTMLADSSMRHVRLYPTILRLSSRAVAKRETLKMLQDEHVGARLKMLTMPTLVVWGSRDRVFPLEHGVLMTRLLPNARLAVIRGAGHMPFYQKPGEFNRLVLDFLRGT